jgi:hypothetical protein
MARFFRNIRLGFKAFVQYASSLYLAAERGLLLQLTEIETLIIEPVLPITITKMDQMDLDEEGAIEIGLG